MCLKEVCSIFGLIFFCTNHAIQNREPYLISQFGQAQRWSISLTADTCVFIVLDNEYLVTKAVLCWESSGTTVQEQAFLFGESLTHHR
jgi:hypothetical protein